MATKVLPVALPAEDISKMRIHAWTGLLVDESGEWLVAPVNSDRSVHVLGTLGGASVRIVGSNEVGTPSAPNILSDPLGNDLVFDAAKLSSLKAVEQVLEHTVQIRPEVVGGDGTTSVTVILLVVRP